MNRIVKIILFAALFVIVIGGAYFGITELSKSYKPQTNLDFGDQSGTSAGSGDKSSGTQEKVLAPDFTVENEQGETVRLSDYKGVPVVLNFWASWCPPCKAEMPHFDLVSGEYQQDEVVFLMVDMVGGNGETKEVGMNYVKSQGFGFTVLYDTAQNASNTYGISSLPTTFFINADGYIESGVTGTIDEATLRKGLGLIVK